MKAEYSDVFDANDRINLDPESLCYVLKKLKHLCIRDAERDAITEAFEVGARYKTEREDMWFPTKILGMLL
jgi:hypothetical protein